MFTRRIATGVLLTLLGFASVAANAAQAQRFQPSPAPVMRVSAFYPITRAALKTWTARTNAPAPVPASAFPSNTTDVGYYFSYNGMVAHRTIYQVVVYDHTGAPYITGNTHKPSYATGEIANYFGGGDPFDKGAYRMDLLLNGVVAASTTFSVGAATAGATQISTEGAIGQRVKKFYAISMSAYRTWTTKAPPPASTRAFPRGTTGVGYYIAYQDMARNTSFQVVIDDQNGAAYATGSKHAFPYVRGEQLSYFSGTPYENGTYRMDLIVNGIVVGSATFTVGG